jgi:hypothetical protein
MNPFILETGDCVPAQFLHVVEHVGVRIDE